MSIDNKIKEIVEESKLAGLIAEDLSLEEDVLDEEELSEEQLDELSKKTLGNYITAASSHRAHLAATDKDLEHKQDQIKKSAKDAPDSIRSRLSSTYDELGKERQRIDKKDMKRYTGIGKAVRKLTKEDIDVSEDVAALINGETLSEDFKQKATTIFEAAVVSRVQEEVALIEEEFQTILEERMAEEVSGLVEKIDGYLDYIVEQWIEQNEIALENGIKNDIMESFISGMKGLFQEHYIDVPEEKYDVLSDMESKIDTLESKLNEQVERNIELRKTISESVKKEIISSSTVGLTATETEKFVDLVEALSFEDESTFKSKVQTLRENYFNTKPNTLIESVVTDSPITEAKQVYTNIDPTVAKYVEALTKLNQ